MRLLSWSVSLILNTSCISSSASFPPAFSCSSTGATSTSTCSNSNWMLLQRTFRHRHTDSQRVVHVLYNNAHSSPEKASSKSLPALSIRPKQTRRKPKARRPNGYWSDRDNLRKEIEMFWHDVGVTTASPPTLSPIPNEALLNHFGRNDLRWAIARHGGREAVSEWMGGVPLVPGKWAEAVATCSEVQQLLDPSNVAGRKLSADVPPKSPQAEHRDIISSSTKPRWKHRPGRKPKGYWTEERVLVEFLKYLYDCKLKMNRPSVWMPRPSELPHDLKGAVARFGGRKKICEQLQLVPFNEWNYFERQFQLILELQKYLETKSGRGSPAEHCFPHMTDVLDDDEYKTLYDLVQYFGGRKFVASRLGLELCGDANSSRRAWQTSYQSTDLTLISFGRFNLDFAVRLLGFIRNDLMEKRPPLKPATIQMPRKELLLARGETRLAEEIEIYGGYENVARRLGLDF